MSHELRTPLNAILGFGQLLDMDELTDHQQEAVRQILKGGDHLLSLINEVLDIARIEVGRMQLSLEPVAVNELVRNAVGLVRPLADQRPVRIEMDLADGDPHVVADRQRLQQVLLNLLSNAVKYNREGGSVRCTTRSVGTERLRIAVSDDGMGMSKEELERLFVPFERLGVEGTGIEGIGLGLALSKQLVDVMMGTLGVESVPGSGSTFTVELPAVPPTTRTVGASTITTVAGAARAEGLGGDP
jgi:signal transduction histidine kinase